MRSFLHCAWHGSVNIGIFYSYLPQKVSDPEQDRTSTLLTRQEGIWGEKQRPSLRSSPRCHQVVLDTSGKSELPGSGVKEFTCISTALGKAGAMEPENKYR